MVLGINVLTNGEPIFYEPEEPKEVDHVEATRKDADNNTRDTSSDDDGGSADVYHTTSLSLVTELTAYTAYCDTGCTGITATGLDVSNTITHEGLRIVAVDPNVIPLGSTVEFTLADGRRITAVAADTGGAIRGNRMDLLVWTRDRALDIGRQNVDVTIHEGR